MTGRRRTSAVLALAVLVGGCSSSGSAGGPTTAPAAAVGAPARIGGWTAVPLLAGTTAGGEPVGHPLTSTVTGIWFGDPEHGVVSLHGDGATASQGGALQSLDAPDHVAATAVEGAAAAGQSWIGLTATPEGLLALGSSGTDLYVSTDAGRTFTARPIAAAGGPEAAPVWFGADAAGGWHEVDTVGNVWVSLTPPGADVVWTRTWQPEAAPPQPNPLPAGTCPFSFRQGYYATDPQQSFWMSSDGATMAYGAGYGLAPSGVCRSTDGGHTFVPVAFPDPPAPGDAGPFVLLFADDSHGLAARADDQVDGAGYVYTTADGGASWTAGTLPASVLQPGSGAAITAGFCAPAQVGRCWLVGFSGDDARGLLLRTDDGGATWTDLSAGLRPFLDTYLVERLHTGFALDADHIWLGGEHGLLLASSTGGT